jgi:hypothetical protein
MVRAVDEALDAADPAPATLPEGRDSSVQPVDVDRTVPDAAVERLFEPVAADRSREVDQSPFRSGHRDPLDEAHVLVVESSRAVHPHTGIPRAVRPVDEDLDRPGGEPVEAVERGRRAVRDDTAGAGGQRRHRQALTPRVR